MAASRTFPRLTAILLIAVSGISGNAQQSPGPGLSKKALAIKRTADKLAPHSPISVVPVQGEEEFGDFLSNSQDGLTFHDVDRKIDVTLGYAEIRKLKRGYGGYNSANGRHTDRTKAIVIAVVVLGALGGVIAAASSARN